MSRRAFLSSGAAASVAAIALGGAEASAAPTNDVDAIVLQVAAAAAVFPVRFETSEGESPDGRLTAQRVARAFGRCSAARAAQARQGAELLRDDDLGGVATEELLERLGALVADAGADELAALKALAAVAGATLDDRLDPENDTVAGVWLGGLAILRRNGETPVVGATS